MKIKLVIIDLELSARAKRIAAAVAIPMLVLGAGAVAYAGAPHTFNNGDVLQAADLMVNFDDLDMRVSGLDQRIIALDQRVSVIEDNVFAKDGNNGSQSCEAWCIQTAMGSPTLAGTCVGAFENGGDYRSCSSTNVVPQGVFCFCSRFGP